MRVKKLIALSVFSVLLVLLLTLSVWQLQRGFTKATIQTQAKQRSAYQSLSEIPNDFSPLLYQTAQLKGHWLNEHSFLLANRSHQNQIGYEVLVPFRLISGQTVVINRGWMAQQDHKPLANLPTSLEPHGILYAPKKGFHLGETLTPQNTWPKTVLYLDMPALSAELQTPLSPLMLVLDQNHPNSLIRIWQPIVMTPERHYAYALQWFGLALALFVLGFKARQHFLDA
ncbi:SURF1 family protein [Thiolinea disciformis]|uniref:SURF1 family protein n=1 Tax=Thiolinea disciformis TaxID=125614 RepID=UPI000380434C|nr:SURF1 family protein [Thiolinea disciformis]